MIKISNKNDINWQEFVDKQLAMISLNTGEDCYKAILIPDELFEELSGKPAKSKLGHEWKDTARCPLCGEHLFLSKKRYTSIVTYDSDGAEKIVSDIESPISDRRCRCGVKIIIG